MDSVRVRLAQLALLLLGFFALPCTVAAQTSHGARAPDAERLKVARRVVQASGAEDLILKSIELTLPLQRAQNPNIPAEFWDRFATRARTDVGALVDSLAPVYASRFSKAELDQLLAFYESPVGRHVAAEQPALAQESQQLGVRWGARVGASIAVELTNESKVRGSSQ
ncbi:MAG TPA: DUF2059 domain-containing protein [Gemmatimonadales bacterium]|jgi:hypothetical protein|nr:DUF2059 domain-containing protein [Gemmatimonadales bacterium]